MNITINGQLSLCLLAEKLLTIEGLKIIQVNTDGVTVAVPIDKEEEYNKKSLHYGRHKLEATTRICRLF